MDKSVFYKFFQNILKENEEIILLIHSHRPFNILFYGIMKLRIHNFTLILTKERIFYIPWFKKDLFKCAIVQINFGALKDIKIKKNKFIIKYLNGKEEALLVVPKDKIEEIKKQIESIDLKGEKNFEKEKIYLCPKCLFEINPLKYSCSNCGCKFKKRNKATIYSIFPGGAYFYIGFNKEAIVIAIYELLLLIIFLIITLKAIRMPPMIIPLFALLSLILFLKIDIIFKALAIIKNLIVEEK